MCKVKILSHIIVNKWTALLVHIRPMKNLNKCFLVKGKGLPTQLFFVITVSVRFIPLI